MTDSYRSQYPADDGPPSMPTPARDAMYRFQANHNGSFQGNRNPPRGPRGYQSGPRSRPNDRSNRWGAISSRPLLRVRQDADDHSFLQPTGPSKFRGVDELTDSEEDEMSESDEDSRPAKRMRTSAMDSPDASATPKWSNPDPYTALPPPPDTTGTRTDVVKLIRKAKISDGSAQEPNDLAKNEDFISFDMFDGAVDTLPDLPTGPRADDPDHLGKRKRDEDEARPRPARGYPHSQKDAPVLREYQASTYVNATPWLSHVSVGKSAAIA